jgi:hypothetical protein
MALKSSRPCHSGAALKSACSRQTITTSDATQCQQMSEETAAAVRLIPPILLDTRPLARIKNREKLTQYDNRSQLRTPVGRHSFMARALKIAPHLKADYVDSPVIGQPGKGEKTPAAYGCSCTYDIAIDAEETFCSLLQAMFPAWRVENHGVPGYSTAHNLIQLKTRIPLE